jgi:hypothetical protein
MAMADTRGPYDRLHVSVPERLKATTRIPPGAGRVASKGPEPKPSSAAPPNHRPSADPLPTAPKKKPPRRASMQERRAIDKQLELVYKKREDDSGYWDYCAGWDDERVATAVGDPDLINSVRNVRMTLYGHSEPKRHAPPRPDVPTKPQVERLLKLITYLYAKLGEPIPDDLLE